MRTNVEIDDELMEEAQKFSGLKTKKDTIEAGLKLLIQMNCQGELRRLRGKIKWTGDLNKMRK